jgi:hypothetical protein
MRTIPVVALSILSLVGAPAFADTTPPAGSPAPAPDQPPPLQPAPEQTVVQPAPVEKPALSPLQVGVRVGAVIPEAFNKLEANFLVGVELAYQLPIPKLHNRLGLYFDVTYSRPTLSDTVVDPRITTCGTGGKCSETYDMVIHDVGFALGVHFWQPLGSAQRWLVFGGLGAKMHLRRTIINATADGGTGGTAQPLGQNQEDSTSDGFGLDLKLGGGYRIGPGAIVVEFRVEYTPIEHLITGGDRPGESANTANLMFLAGYSFFLL